MDKSIDGHNRKATSMELSWLKFQQKRFSGSIFDVDAVKTYAYLMSNVLTGFPDGIFM